MVVDHSPAVFGFCPNGRIPTRAVGHAAARQNKLSRHERVFLAEHPHDDVFKAQNLQRLARFPETFSHSIFDRFDTARRTRRTHFGRVLCISRQINAQIALIPTLGGHLQSRPDRLFILALPKHARRTDRANKNRQKYKLFHISPSRKLSNLTRPPAKGFAPQPAHDKNTRKIKFAGAKVEICGAKVERCGAKVEQCGAKVEQCGVKVERCGAKVERRGVKVEVCSAKVERCGAKVKACGVKVKACNGKVERCASIVESRAHKVENNG